MAPHPYVRSFFYHSRPAWIVTEWCRFQILLRPNFFLSCKINARLCGAPGSADCNIQHCGRLLVIGEWSQCHPHTSGHRQAMTSTLPGTIVMQRCHA